MALQDGSRIWSNQPQAQLQCQPLSSTSAATATQLRALRIQLAFACVLVKLSSTTCNSSILYDTVTLVLVFSAVRRRVCVAAAVTPAKPGRFELLNQIEFIVEGKHMSCAKLFPAANKQIRVLSLVMQISFKLRTSKPNPTNLRIAGGSSGP